MTNLKAADLRALADRNPSNKEIQTLAFRAFQGNKAALASCAKLIASGR